MHVGVVVYDSLAETSGGYRYDRKLVDHLESRGDTVDVVAIPRRSSLRNLADNLSPRLRRRLDRPFDVLVQDGLCHPSLVAHNPLDGPTATVALVHLLWTVAGDGPLAPVHRALERRFLAGVDGVVCTSEHTRLRVRSLVDAPATVAYPGGRAGGAALSPEFVTERARDGPLRILFLGALVERKGVSTLLSALESLAGEWTATIVGPTDDDPAHAARIRERVERSSARVDLRGAVPDDELRAVFERSHVLALPSQYESFGMAYLEAMEYGVVPLATTVGGPPEFIEDGESGRLLPPGEPGALRETLSTLADDREHLAALARGALEAAAAHPSWSESMEQVRSFLADCGGEPA